MTAPWLSLTVERGSTPRIVAPVLRPDGTPEILLSSMALTFTMARKPDSRDRRKVTKTNAAGEGITVGTGDTANVATVQLTRTDLELADANATTVLVWDLVAVSGTDRVPLARGELVVLAVPSEFA